MDVADLVDQLVDLARILGGAPRRYAILGEGNVSARMDTSTFLVKASGTVMATATAQSLVRVDLTRAMELVHAPPADDEAVTIALRSTLADGATGAAGRPSVETGMHAVLLTAADARWVAHTHPEPVTAVLCSVHAAALAAGILFPDQVVVCGPHPLFLPYVDPGIPLARALAAELDRHLATYGVAPKAVYLQSHGFVALGNSAREVLAITDMAVKAATILATALACGGLNYLPPHEVLRIAGRSDEHYRQRALGLTAPAAAPAVVGAASRDDPPPIDEAAMTETQGVRGDGTEQP